MMRTRFWLRDRAVCSVRYGVNVLWGFEDDEEVGCP